MMVKSEIREPSVFQCLLEQALQASALEDSARPVEKAADEELVGEMVASEVETAQPFDEIVLSDPYGATPLLSPKMIQTLDNSLRYELKKAPPTIEQKEVLKRWKELKARAKKTEDDNQELSDMMVELVRSAKQGEWESVAFKTTTKVEKIIEGRESEEWIPWATFEKSHGKVLAMELLRIGSAVSRLHHSLVGVEHAAPYPDNQEVQLVRKVIDRKRVLTEGAELEKKRTPTEEEAEALENMLRTAMSEMTRAPSPSPRKARKLEAIEDATEEQKKEEEAARKKEEAALKVRAESAIKYVKASHADWDRKKQDWKGVVKQSRENENTNGCRIESDLVKLIEEATAQDENMMQFHTHHVAGKALTDENIAVMKEAAAALAITIKKAKSKVTALTGSFKA